MLARSVLKCHVMVGDTLTGPDRGNTALRRVVTAAVLAVACGFLAAPANAHPITASLEGCVLLTDERLAEAVWFATGTFQAVAFDDPAAGCDMTITQPVLDAYEFEEDRLGNTLKASLNMANLPTCGRRQYDVHYYLAEGILDPMGLKSLVIDTGVDCFALSIVPIVPIVSARLESVPEPANLVLLAVGLGWASRRRWHAQVSAVCLNRRPPHSQASYGDSSLRRSSH